MWDADQAYSLFVQVIHLIALRDPIITPYHTHYNLIQLSFMQALNAQTPKNVSRRLAAVSSILFRDIIAVASGLRPSFLLDYLIIDYNQLATIICTGLDLLPHQLATQQLCLLTLGDCCLVTNVTMLPKGQLSHPLFIEFDSNPKGGMNARWANEIEQATRQNKVEALIAAVLAQLQLPPGSIAMRIPILDLESISQNVDIVMPTLNGWFLGYPVSYAVHDMVNAQSASRCLSTTTLRLYSVFTKLTSLRSSLNNVEVERSPLFSFSLPANLVESDEWRERRKEWEKTLRKQHKTAEDLWGKLSIEGSACMRGIAL